MEVNFNIPINIAVSSCLAGEAVRYDASDKTNSLIVNQYARYFDLELICPEMAIGLGVPREPIMIVSASQQGQQHSLVVKNNSTINITNKMLSYAKQQVFHFEKLCGYIVKERSPSCGLTQTPYHSIQKGIVNVISNGAGIFTEQISNHLLRLPIISEEGLCDETLRENFIERCCILHLWNVLQQSFQQSEKYSEIFLEIFKEKIKHQIELRVGNNIALEVLEASNSVQSTHHYITNIMAILKTPVTIEMTLKFLHSKLQEYNLSSDRMTLTVQQYQNHEISLYKVLQQFQKQFERNNIIVKSNYFYPDKRELKTRGHYFG